MNENQNRDEEMNAVLVTSNEKSNNQLPTRCL